MMSGPGRQHDALAGGLRRLRRGDLQAIETDGLETSTNQPRPAGIDQFSAQLDKAVARARTDGGTMLVLRLRHRALPGATSLGNRRPAINPEILERLTTLEGTIRAIAISGSEIVGFVPMVRRRSDGEQLLSSIIEFLEDPITVGGLPHYLSPIAGGALLDGENTGVDRLFEAATLALAATDPTQPALMFHPYQRVRNERRSELELALREAVLDDSMTAAFQPIVELTTGRIVGFEVFARWFRNSGQQVDTAEFIQLGKELGMLHLLSRQVLERSLDSIKHLLDRGLLGGDPERGNAEPITLWANVTSTEVRHPDFVDTMGAVIEREPRLRVGFELTPMPAGDARDMYERLKVLVAAGARAAVGDFGVGPANLATLPKLPFDAVTVDSALIRQIGASEQVQGLVMALVGMADLLDLQAKAAAVESEQQAEVLRAIGCATGQGYHLGEPMLVDELVEWLAFR